MKAKLLSKEIRKHNYRYLGFAIVRDEFGREYRLPITGTIVQWLKEGEEFDLEIRGESIGFDTYSLKGKVEIWPPFSREYTAERCSPLTGKPLYSYRLLAREARFERDYEAIVELEQYHYASDEEMLALWHCERCDLYREGNVQPKCPRCGADMRFHDLKSATRASRFLVMELLDKAPYEPRYVGYVRVDPPVPLMSRRVPGGVEREIREKVFPPEWFAHPFRPKEDVPPERWWEEQGEALKEARSPVSRLARVVVHPDYRVDGLGQQAVRTMIDWVRERWVPEMRIPKEAIETVAMMARYNPFMEKVGFIYLWETGGGRPALYYPLTETAEKAIKRFLETDELGRRHGGKLYRTKFKPVEKLESPLIIRGLTKSYTSELALEELSEPVRRLLEAFGVRRRVIQKFVIRNGNIEIAPGTVNVIVGASGSGKTTLLRVIYGLAAGSDDPLYRPEGGEFKLPKNARVQAYIPGEMEPEFGDEPIAEVLFRITGDESLAVEILNYAGISDAVLYRAPFRELSTGQKERAKIAYLLAHRPNLILIDEFAAHLDPTTAIRVARRMSQVAREKNITLLLATHRDEVIKALEPDRIYMVGYGTLFRYGELPDKGFRVMEPYATYIVEGKKRWEIRRYPTKVRGRVGVVSGDKLIGTVEIVGSKGPFSVEELSQHQDRHLSNDRFLREYSKGEKLYVWELKEAEKFDKPIPIDTKKGQRVWVKIEKQGEGDDRV